MAGSALRRLAGDQPASSLAIWAKTLASASIMVALLALAVSHARGPIAAFVAVLSFSPTRAPSPGLGLFLFLVALAIAAASALTACAAMAAIWTRGLRGAKQIIAAFLLLALFIPYPVWLMQSTGAPPFLADISTDYLDPPAFSAEAAGARGWVPRPIDPGRAQAQVAAYPDVKPVLLDLDADEAYAAARDAATRMGWSLLDEVRPGGESRPEGRIEALTHTAALRIPVAVAIRIRPGEAQTRVDMRVVTRYTPNDFGGGSALIGKLTEALEDRDSAE
jgi:hypothetical protein